MLSFAFFAFLPFFAFFCFIAFFVIYRSFSELLTTSPCDSLSHLQSYDMRDPVPCQSPK
ncbi:hypothetical protein LX36DRAFT_653997 [Colletotrichum falcatum]|nr:hypothetical protein LX36DRAFT_653997 [Colletotrichum falcatum]